MLRRFLESFTATHATILASVAMLGSGAAVAAVAYQPVAIVNPSTGATAYVSPGKLLYVYDQIAGYRNNPANFMTITVSNHGTRCEGQQYTVPAGKSLILTAISGDTSGGNGSSGFFLYRGASCTGPLLTTHFGTNNSATGSGHTAVAVDLGTGIAIPSGVTISIYSSNNSGYTFLHGYFAPASAVPAAGSADAAYQGQEVTANDVAIKERRLNRAQ